MYYKFMDSTKSFHQKAKQIYIPTNIVKKFKRKALPHFPTLFLMLDTVNPRDEIKTFHGCDFAFYSHWINILC